MIEKFWNWWNSTEVNPAKSKEEQLVNEKLKLILELGALHHSMVMIKNVCNNTENGNLLSLAEISKIAKEALND